MNHKIVEIQINFRNLPFDQSKIYSLLGYNLENIPLPVSDWVDEVYTEISNHVNIRSGYVLMENLLFNKMDFSISSGNWKIYPNKTVYGKMKKAESMAIFVCTLGQTVSDWSSQMLKGDDVMKGYISDLMASEIAEAAIDHLQTEIETRQALKKKFITNRYSPGYCSWDVSDQHNLFKAFPSGFCGVTLLESALMHPVKSVSGIIGIGKEVKKEEYGCKICDAVDCIFRNLHA